jgi:hypothetical protein
LGSACFYLLVTVVGWGTGIYRYRSQQGLLSQALTPPHYLDSLTMHENHLIVA